MHFLTHFFVPFSEFLLFFTAKVHSFPPFYISFFCMHFPSKNVVSKQCIFTLFFLRDVQDIFDDNAFFFLFLFAFSQQPTERLVFYSYEGWGLNWNWKGNRSLEINFYTMSYHIRKKKWTFPPFFLIKTRAFLSYISWFRIYHFHFPPKNWWVWDVFLVVVPIFQLTLYFLYAIFLDYNDLATTNLTTA